MIRLLAAALVAASSAQAATPADFAAVFPIITADKQPAWLVQLDVEVYRWSQDEDLRDLAIFNAAGNAVPIGPWEEITPTRIIEDHAEAPLLDLPRVVIPDESARGWRTPGPKRKVRPVEVRSTAHARPNREWLIDATHLQVGVDTIRLDWDSPKSGVVARFDVVGSTDLETWFNSRRGATVLTLEQDGTRIDRREIELEHRYPYLKLIRIDDGPDLVGLRAEISGHYGVRGEPQALQWIDAKYRNTVSDDASHEAQYRYELPAALPVSEVRIGLFDDNALARVQVLSAIAARDGSMRWSSRAEAVGYRLRRGEDLIENPDVALSPGPRVRLLRIDSTTPLARPPRLGVGFRPQQIAFLAEGDGPYVLAVGSSRARRPNYPIATAIERLRDYPSWRPPSATLGSMQISAGEKAVVAPVARAETPGWKRWLLWSVLVGAAAIVAGIAISLLRGAGQPGAEKREQPPEE